jgi:hypothetical protein
MTERKPPTVSFPDWIEHQIRTAERAGAFENLSGAGKPIPNIDRPQDDLDWVANYLRREQVDVASVLPPALALAKEVEDLAGRLAERRAEAEVRHLVEDLNDRIRRAHRQPQVGPPIRVRPLNIDAVIEQWRTDRAQHTRPAPQIEASQRPEPGPRRRPLRTRLTRRRSGSSSA